MAIIALGVAFDAVDAALATPRGVALAGRSPSGTPCHPADLSLAHRTPKPITAPLLQQHHFARGTGQSLPQSHHLVYHLFGTFRVFVDLRFLRHTFLVLFAVHAHVDCLKHHPINVTNEVINLLKILKVV